MKKLVFILSLILVSCGRDEPTPVDLPVPPTTPPTEVSQFQVVDPCGDDPGHADEVVLVFDDGSVLSWLKPVGLYLLEEGEHYVTRDHQQCHYTIQDGAVVELNDLNETHGRRRKGLTKWIEDSH